MMNLFHSYEKLNTFLKGKKISITIGNFDGVHSGHDFLLTNFIRYSNERDVIPVVITFDPHPYVFISKKKNHILLTPERKLEEMQRIGINTVLTLEFNDSLKSKTGEQFIQDLLGSISSISTIYVGHDFSLGEEKGFTFKSLMEMNLSPIELVQEKQFSKGSFKVSSSLIRSQLRSGDIKRANFLLERAFEISGVVEQGNQLGSKLNFPTANISFHVNQVIPKQGVYLGRACVKGNTYKAAINIGLRPTATEDVRPVLEAHILNFNEEIYGEKITIELIQFIREEKEFKNLDLLKRQISLDLEQMKNLAFEASFALIGRGIKHSLSERMYAKLLDGFPIKYTLLDFETENKIPSISKLLIKYKQISVTSPYKKYCFKKSDYANKVIKYLESVNALKLLNGDVHGSNTDLLACREIFINNFKGKYKDILLVGDGAMSKVLKLILNEFNIKYSQFSRRLKNLNQLSQVISAVEEPQCLLVINCCSRDFIFPDFTTQFFTLWDLNYSMGRHQRKSFINKVNYIDGRELLYLQAKYALSFWNCKTT